MSGLAIVTGASRGIGAATARAFLDRGWAVIGLSRSPCPVNGVRHLAVDLGHDRGLSAAQALAPLLPTSGRICLVHNAAAFSHDTALTLDPAAFAALLDLNVVAPATLNRAVRPYMGPGSSILYVGSTLSEKAVPGAAGYITSKHAVIGLMRATCQDLVRVGIHTAAVCPGFTATEMLLENIGTDPAVRASIEAMSTLGRLVEPEEIAELLLFAAEHPVINGAVLHGNLGQVER